MGVVEKNSYCLTILRSSGFFEALFGDFYRVLLLFVLHGGVCLFGLEVVTYGDGADGRDEDDGGDEADSETNDWATVLE